MNPAAVPGAASLDHHHPIPAEVNLKRRSRSATEEEVATLAHRKAKTLNPRGQVLKKTKHTKFVDPNNKKFHFHFFLFRQMIFTGEGILVSVRCCVVVFVRALCVCKCCVALLCCVSEVAVVCCVCGVLGAFACVVILFFFRRSTCGRGGGGSTKTKPIPLLSWKPLKARARKKKIITQKIKKKGEEDVRSTELLPLWNIWTQERNMSTWGCSSTQEEEEDEPFTDSAGT